MKTILAPVDFSDATEIVLAQAAELARKLDSRLIVLHVTEPVATYMPVGASMDILSTTPPPLQAENAEEQQNHLERVIAPLRNAGVAVEAVAIVGLAVDDIVEHAKESGAGMIILGSHGHGALHHLFSGSVVTGVLKHATCPVLIIPIPPSK